MATFQIRRGDPTSAAPGDDPSLTDPLSAPDKTIICLGAKMFSSSDVGFISRGDQERRVGRTSNGRWFASTARTPVSHGTTVNVPFSGTDIPAETAEKMDQYIKDQMADLVFRRYLIITVDGGARLAPDDVRNYSIT